MSHPSTRRARRATTRQALPPIGRRATGRDPAESTAFAASRAVAGLVGAAGGTGAIPVVWFHENDPGARRASTDKRAQPIGEASRPTRDATADAAVRATRLGTIVDWLAAESSPRYLRRLFTTFCNVYASDFAYLAGAYLPRTWWTDDALAQIARGRTPAVTYGGTIREMRADDLHDWLTKHGQDFGWRRVDDPAALQDAANAGGLGVICADRAAPGKAGHITLVVPETSTHRAVRSPDGRVTLPLQTQAGATNFRYGTVGRAWWADAEYRSFVMCVHD
jgi:hypothetical protein